MGFEALLRWNHPKHGPIRPLEFLPLAEETGFINHLGRWVLKEACQQMRDWQKRYPHKPPLTMSVNISGCQLNQPNFAEQVRSILGETGLEGKYLKLEVNEGVCLNGSENMLKACQDLNAMGIQFQIDDFGIGTSSLSYLQYLPIETLKIDRVFIDKVNANNNSEIVRAIIALARDLGIEAIAEGIETENQLNMLLDLGCNFGQGFLLSRPLDRTAIDSLLTKESTPLKEETHHHLPALQVKYVT
jgi:EAL domain-containing protein (putative c-di-GMP-specific phosphodiesterase class I)